MKLLLLFLEIAFMSFASQRQSDIDQQFPTMEQLDSLYLNQWNLQKYNIANSAFRAVYLNAAEKKIIYYLNLVRLNPKTICGHVCQWIQRFKLLPQ